MRKRYDKEFKAKVAIEAMKGDKTLQEIATQYEVHPNLVAQWKRQLIEMAAQLFEKAGKGNAAAEEAERKTDALFRQIGQLQVENDFLKKSIGNCTGASRSYRAEAPNALDREAMRDFGYQPVSVLLQAGSDR